MASVVVGLWCLFVVVWVLLGWIGMGWIAVLGGDTWGVIGYWVGVDV